MDLTDKKVVVVGTGVSGMGAVKLLSETSADITLYDGNDKADRDEILKKIPDDCDLRLIIGD